MTIKIPSVIKETARKLRNNMTESEKILWSEIRFDKIWYRFLRQKPVYVFTENSWLDRFIIPDFYCYDQKIIIEVDWNIHNIKEIYELDKYKEDLLIKMWYTVIRIKNEEIINNVNLVIEKIKQNEQANQNMKY